MLTRILGAGDEQKGAAKGPTFLSKPRIIPKDGGALIVMECRVKSVSKPHGVWYKNGAPIHENALYSIFFSDLGESSYLLQLELHVSTCLSYINFHLVEAIACKFLLYFKNLNS